MIDAGSTFETYPIQQIFQNLLLRFNIEQDSMNYSPSPFSVYYIFSGQHQ